MRLTNNLNFITRMSFSVILTCLTSRKEDVNRTSPRKKGLLKIFDFINSDDDIGKLKREAGPNSHEALKNYNEFIEEIIKNKADFTLDTENETVKAN